MEPLFPLEIKDPKLSHYTGFCTENREITYLSLLSYTVDRFPERITELRSLKELNLAYNEYSSISESIGNLFNLERLSLNDNKLKNLPFSIQNLKNLKYFNLSDNFFEEISEVICSLDKLEILKIKSNLVKIIMSNIKNLENLKELYISDNEFGKLPKKILLLKNLKKLSVFLFIDKEDEVYQELLNKNVELIGIQMR